MFGYESCFHPAGKVTTFYLLFICFPSCWLSLYYNSFCIQTFIVCVDAKPGMGQCFSDYFQLDWTRILFIALGEQNVRHRDTLATLHFEAFCFSISSNILQRESSSERFDKGFSLLNLTHNQSRNFSEFKCSQFTSLMFNSSSSWWKFNGVELLRLVSFAWRQVEWRNFLEFPALCARWMGAKHRKNKQCNEPFLKVNLHGRLKGTFLPLERETL